MLNKEEGTVPANVRLLEILVNVNKCIVLDRQVVSKSYNAIRNDP